MYAVDLMDGMLSTKNCDRQAHLSSSHRVFCLHTPPVKFPDGNPALRVSFLRKKTAEKGSVDGGILFSSCLVSEEDCDEDGILENYKKRIQLTAWRISKGQTVSKSFSEKQILLAFVKGLSEGRGAEVLMEGGNVEVDSVFHLWM